jgi:high-affinity Fe2+/Pb2+ permease
LFIVKKRHELTLNVPLLALLLISTVAIAWIVWFLGKLSGLFLFEVIGFCVGLFGLFVCFYVMIKCLYLLVKILNGKCYFCNRKLENKSKKAIKFLLTPPWKKRKVEFICLDCKRQITKKR